VVKISQHDQKSVSMSKSCYCALRGR